MILGRAGELGEPGAGAGGLSPGLLIPVRPPQRDRVGDRCKGSQTLGPPGGQQAGAGGELSPCPSCGKHVSSPGVKGLGGVAEVGLQARAFRGPHPGDTALSRIPRLMPAACVVFQKRGPPWVLLCGAPQGQTVGLPPTLAQSGVFSLSPRLVHPRLT